MKTFNTWLLTMSLLAAPLAANAQETLFGWLKGTLFQKSVVAAVNGPAKDPRETGDQAVDQAIRRNADVALTRNLSASVLKARSISTKEADLTKSLRTSFGAYSSRSKRITDPSLSKTIGTALTKTILQRGARDSLAVMNQVEVARKSAIRDKRTFHGGEALDQLNDFPALIRQIRRMTMEKGPLFALDNLVVTKAGSGKNRIVEFPNTNTRIEIRGNAFYAKGGSTPGRGAMNEFLNGPVPNGVFFVDEHLKYVTDSKGRTVQVECFSSELSKSVTRTRMARENQTRVVEAKGGKQGVHDSGHIQQYSTGGINEDINLLPMRVKQQRGGAWANLEKKEREAIEAGNRVSSKKTITYNPDGSYTIHVDLTITDLATGKVKTVSKDFGKLFSPKDK